MLSTLRRERGITRLVLRGLDITHVSALVDSIVGPNAPSQLPRMILDSTDGNPFFVTEMLRHLRETKAIARVGGLSEASWTSRISDCQRVSRRSSADGCRG